MNKSTPTVVGGETTVMKKQNLTCGRKQGNVTALNSSLDFVPGSGASSAKMKHLWAPVYRTYRTPCRIELVVNHSRGESQRFTKLSVTGSQGDVTLYVHCLLSKPEGGKYCVYEVNFRLFKENYIVTRNKPINTA